MGDEEADERCAPGDHAAYEYLLWERIVTWKHAYETQRDRVTELERELGRWREAALLSDEEVGNDVFPTLSWERGRPLYDVAHPAHLETKAPVMTNPSESETVEGLSEEEVEAAARAMHAREQTEVVHLSDWEPETWEDADHDWWMFMAAAALTAAATLRPPREAEGRYREALERIMEYNKPSQFGLTDVFKTGSYRHVYEVARQVLQEQPNDV